jgi:hypothetical protein
VPKTVVSENTRYVSCLRGREAVAGDESESLPPESAFGAVRCAPSFRDDPMRFRRERRRSPAPFSLQYGASQGSAWGGMTASSSTDQNCRLIPTSQCLHSLSLVPERSRPSGDIGTLSQTNRLLVQTSEPAASFAYVNRRMDF